MNGFHGNLTEYHVAFGKNTRIADTFVIGLRTKNSIFYRMNSGTQ